MMLNGGGLDGVRILGRKTVELVFANHTGDISLWLTPPGVGFGLGYAVPLDRGEAATPRPEGTGYWGGPFGTSFWVDLKRNSLVSSWFNCDRTTTCPSERFFSSR